MPLFTLWFNIDESLADDVKRFLDEKLDKQKHSYAFGFGRMGLILKIYSDSKDKAFTCGEWLRLNRRSPLRGMPYSVAGSDDKGRIIYLSFCEKCRKDDKSPHYAH